MKSASTTRNEANRSSSVLANGLPWTAPSSGQFVRRRKHAERRACARSQTRRGHVFAGTINQRGAFRFRAGKVGAGTVLAHPSSVWYRRARQLSLTVQRLVDRIAAIFVPAIIGITSFHSPCGGYSPCRTVSRTAWAGLLVTVLIIALPLALGLATPTAIMVGIGKAAEHGILIKDAESLETARENRHCRIGQDGHAHRRAPLIVRVSSGKKTVRQICPISFTASKNVRNIYLRQKPS